MPLVLCNVPGTVYLSHLFSLQSIKQIRRSRHRERGIPARGAQNSGTSTHIRSASNQGYAFLA